MPAIADPSHERFAQEYVALGCRRSMIKAAARAAGLDIGNKIYPIVNSPVVIDRIRELTTEIFGDLGISARTTFEEIARIAYVDPGELFDENGDLKPISELPPGVRAAIASIDVEIRWEGRGDDAVPITVKKIRFWDKQTALGLLARHFKIVGDEKEGINALAGELANRLAAARARRKAREDAPLVEEVKSAIEDATVIEQPAALLSPLPAMVPVTAEHDDDDALWKPNPTA